jgi:acyl phosphate:glycerol-3-phosphate acyltransferase
MTDILIAAASYFIGCIPSAYLFGRLFKKTDIRNVGTGNVGAMNTFKNIGFLPGLLTLFADMAKGAGVFYIAYLFGNLSFLPILCAIIVITGHNYNIFMGFKGGKGLGCVVGILLVINPVSVLMVFGVVGLLILILKDTDTASAFGLFDLPVILALLTNNWTLFTGGAIISVLIFAKYFPEVRDYVQKRKRREESL